MMTIHCECVATSSMLMDRLPPPFANEHAIRPIVGTRTPSIVRVSQDADNVENLNRKSELVLPAKIANSIRGLRIGLITD